ncbi:MAG: ABC transporter permease [Planctomycetota bacterium]
MRALARLAWLYASRTPVQTAIVSVGVAVSLALLVTGRVLISRAEMSLTARAEAVPLVAGAPGSRFDLALALLYFRPTPIAPMTMGDVEDAATLGRGVVVPVHASLTAGGDPVVAVGYEFFEQRALAAAEGRFPIRLGEAVLGWDTARRSGLVVGDTFRTDRRELFDLSVASPIVLRVVGVLAHTGSVDDGAVFVDIQTAWLAEGILHAHAAAATLPDDQIQTRTERSVVVEPTSRTERDVSAAEQADVHMHADPRSLPVTGALVFPASDKDLTILQTRLNGDGRLQAVRPVALVRELFDVVFRLRPVLDGVTGLLAATSIAMIVLAAVLAARLRSEEFEALDHLGTPRSFVIGLVVAQTAINLLLGMLLAGLLVAGAAWSLDRWLGV